MTNKERRTTSQSHAGNLLEFLWKSEPHLTHKNDKNYSSMFFSLTINFNNSEEDGHQNTSINKHKTKFNLSLNTTHWTLFGFRTTLFVEYLRCKFPMLSLNNKIHTQNRSLIGHQIPHIYYKLCFFSLYA